KLHDLKERAGVKFDHELSSEQLRELCDDFKRFFREQTGGEFPQDPWEQLCGAINAVFESWNAEKAVTYRRVEKITDLKGTGVNVQQMVFGNMGEDSGTGVAFTRDPSTGENTFYGDMLFNAQGEDVVAGIRTPMKLSDMQKKQPAVYDQLVAIRAVLETNYKEMQDLEFTFERGKLYMLQCRAGKRAPTAVFRIAVEQATQPLVPKREVQRLVKAKLLPKKYATLASKPVITKDDAIKRITQEDVERLFYPIISPKVTADQLKNHQIAEGINAVPGAACGKVVFSAKEAEEMAAHGESVILVRKETSPEDVDGMHSAAGILTSTGGMTSHAAVVARGWGKCCVAGAGEIHIDAKAGKIKVGGKTYGRKDILSIDGSTGEVFAGEMATVSPKLSGDFATVMKW
ncbi:MAG: PEP-utilizing enzyme, partial [Chlorobiales bacterium]|nr:PEP-utilizing enzyme [Chlorobiales bacterium]